MEGVELTLYADGFEYISKERTIQVQSRKADENGEDKGVEGFIIRFIRGRLNEDVRPTCSFRMEEGKSITSIALSDDAISDLFFCMNEYKKSKMEDIKI